MKTKFETNVASELPKTRNSQEPGLPWKVSSEELEKAASKDGEYKLAVTGIPPLRVRAIFLALLLGAIFIAVVSLFSTMAIEDEKIRQIAKQKEESIASLQTTLEKINSEKNSLNKAMADLQQKVGELTSQKDLYTAVLESLAKKTEEPQNATPPMVKQNTQNISQ